MIGIAFVAIIIGLILIFAPEVLIGRHMSNNRAYGEHAAVKKDEKKVAVFTGKCFLLAGVSIIAVIFVLHKLGKI